MPIKVHRPSLGILAALGIVLLGIVSRLIEPRGYGDFDETIYAQTLLLWLSGPALYQEIFYSQGPVFLMLLAPFALIPGPSLEVIQLGVTFWGSVGLAAVAFLGYRIGGSWGAAVSAAVVAASPLVTHLDSHALAEGPAISLTALGLAVLWRNGTTPVQGAIAGALLGASLAVKALMPAALIPVLGYFLTSRLSVRRRAILLLSLALGTTLILVLALIPFSPAALWDQLVVYRAEAHNASNAAPGSSMAIIARGLRDDLGAMFAAFVGAILLARAARGTAIILIVWLIGTVTLLAAHQPLFARHSAALLLPMALLASGVGLVARSVGSRGSGKVCRYW